MESPHESAELLLRFERTKTLSEMGDLRCSVPIADNGDPLVRISEDKFHFFWPPPYVAAGAPYGQSGPFYLRKEVAARLEQAQAYLQAEYPSYKFKIFDGYRPIAVQSYMIEYTLRKLAKDEGLNPENLAPAVRDKLMQEVLNVWAKPDSRPTSPPPHSTGAAVDLTIMDERNILLDMGGDIDGFPPESLPNYYRDKPDPYARICHLNREILRHVMEKAGFRRLTHEWWHFSYGDQMWALLERAVTGRSDVNAVYGRCE